ncbi:hypothetical protein TNCV_4941291 [Trichonephila clavipes]|nr:hypothetical protein TNCV_4941291 [Trichonephila clavipes]
MWLYVVDNLSLGYFCRNLLAVSNESLIKCIPSGIDAFPNDFFTQQERLMGGVAVHILIALYTCAMIGIVCHDYFVPSLEIISDRMKLPADIAGATFMAIGTSAPELFSSITGSFITEGDIGVGTIIGSAVFNIVGVTGLVGVILWNQVLDIDWYPIARDCIVYGVTIFTLIWIISDNIIVWWEAFVLLLIFAIYIIMLCYNQKLEIWSRDLVESFQWRKCCPCCHDSEESPLLKRKILVPEIAESQILQKRLERDSFSVEFTASRENAVLRHDSILRKVGLGLDMDNVHHIIIQSYRFCQLTCSLKFSVLRRICTGIIVDHLNYLWIMILLRQSRKQNEAPIEGDALGQCLEMFLLMASFHELVSDILNCNLHWCAKIKDEVEKLAYQLNEEAERTERPIRTLRTAIRGFSSGCPRGTTPADDRYIVLQARRNRRQTAGEIARHTTQTTGRPISRFTVARRLHGGGLFARRPVRCVPLTPAHRRRRSLWCREHRNWRDNEWGRVLFTDESRFSLSSHSRRILIWRERGSRNHPSNIIERDRYEGRGVLVWGGIMLGSRTDLHIFDAGSVNGTRY